MWVSVRHALNAREPTPVRCDCTSVLYRCIGDLSTMQCKDTATENKWSGQAASQCVRNPKEAQRSLLNSATALDSYVGWIAASWVTFFKSDERELHVVRRGASDQHV